MSSLSACYLTCVLLAASLGRAGSGVFPDVMTYGRAAVLRSWRPPGSGFAGFRCAGRRGGLRADVPEPAADPRRGEPAFTLASPQRLTCPRQRPCGPEHQARYPASYTRTLREETRPCGTRFPAAFQPPAFASWAPCPARDFRPSYDRPTARPALTRACRTDPDEVYTFRAHETQPGRAPSLPRGQRCSPAIGVSAAVACRLSTARPCHPGSTTQPRMLV
jgi:hypothetical protein